MSGYTVWKEGRSPDGSLRFEQRVGEMYESGRYDGQDVWYVLIDTDSDAVIADCKAWSSSEITVMPDGSLFLLVGYYARDHLFRIDPLARTFHEFAVTDPPVYPLDRLGEALAAAHSMPQGDFRRLAPDGSIAVELEATEWANGQWVYAPRVIEIATDRIILDLWGTDWDASAFFPAPRTVQLGVRRYTNRGFVQLKIDLSDDSFVILRDPETAPTPTPLTDLLPRLHEAAERSVAEQAKQPRTQPPGAPRQPTWWIITRFLLLLVGSLALIAIATWISLILDPPPKQQLTPLPDFGNRAGLPREGDGR